MLICCWEQSSREGENEDTKEKWNNERKRRGWDLGTGPLIVTGRKKARINADIERFRDPVVGWLQPCNKFSMSDGFYFVTEAWGKVIFYRENRNINQSFLIAWLIETCFLLLIFRIKFQLHNNVHFFSCEVGSKRAPRHLAYCWGICAYSCIFTR